MKRFVMVSMELGMFGAVIGAGYSLLITWMTSPTFLSYPVVTFLYVLIWIPGAVLGAVIAQFAGRMIYERITLANAWRACWLSLTGGTALGLMLGQELGALVGGFLGLVFMIAEVRRPRVVPLFLQRATAKSLWKIATASTMIFAAGSILHNHNETQQRDLRLMLGVRRLPGSIAGLRCHGTGFNDYMKECSLSIAPGDFELLLMEKEFREFGCDSEKTAAREVCYKVGDVEKEGYITVRTTQERREVSVTGVWD